MNTSPNPKEQARAALAAERSERIGARLDAALAPLKLAVIDEGRKHVGHAGARDGRGHFAVHIVSAAFVGRSPVQRHRMVYDALGELMLTEVHALSVDAKTPEES